MAIVDQVFCNVRFSGGVGCLPCFWRLRFALVGQFIADIISIYDDLLHTNLLMVCMLFMLVGTIWFYYLPGTYSLEVL